MEYIAQVAIWLVNGFLAVLWLIADNLLVLVTLPLLGWMIAIAPAEQRPWAASAAGLALAGIIILPFPASALTLIMTIAGIAGYYLEKFNKPTALWTMIRGIALYGMVCIGFGIFRRFFYPSALDDPALQQGLVYLNVIASISLYIVPLGFLALVAQGLFAHPPLRGTADEMIYQFRSRGKR